MNHVSTFPPKYKYHHQDCAAGSGFAIGRAGLARRPRPAGSPFVTEVGVAKAQAVPYSHQLHVGELGSDCRYCHSSVETSNTASIPSTATCMGVMPKFPKIRLIDRRRDSLENNTPLEWIALRPARLCLFQPCRSRQTGGGL